MSDLYFNKNYLVIIEKLGLGSDVMNVAEAAFRDQTFDNLSNEELVASLMIANALYRAGHPIVSDERYDFLISLLVSKDPNNEFLAAVEPEVVFESKTVPLPQKMLSTDKAYSFNEIKKWVDRILKAAEELQISLDDVNIRVTPKLDGYAAYDDGQILYTRGDGLKGQDITRAFNRGLKVAAEGERGLGPGEIVINKNYFDEELSQYFENSRNIQAAIIAEKKIDEKIQKAIDLGQCVFYPFSLINNWIGHFQKFLSNFDSIIESIWNSIEYDVDGVVIETTNDKIKEHMGATRKFHRWQIAFKVNEEAAEVEVLRVIPQTSRTGRVSPVAELVPTKLSGATISRATVHHYNMVKNNGIGTGAVVKLVRSGLVIPKIEAVIKRVEPQLPETCPSCNTLLHWSGEHLICDNKNCPARKENTLIHFFKTLGNIDGFGPKVIEKLHLYGIDQIHQLYELTEEQLMSFGFGEKTSQNLVEQLRASREIEIEDWRFLAAFGVNRLGGGNCEKLLQHHSLIDLFDLTVENIVSIDGFAELSAVAIVDGLENIKAEFLKVHNFGFNLSRTSANIGAEKIDSPITGKIIVFTGKMLQGSRDDMEKQAKALGAKPAKSVTGKTDYLVAGENVGESKIKAATDKGIAVLTEQEYLNMLSSS
ncbi:BRCT domain-containing protein [uncultured Tolumonas sp.]|uniref:BRCT domain-containing protein n=1 Tax=uncultured Tolumonas sp. TaxID=263765 RepID=UPI00292E5723|nr:BRCT domain-containing protein [uncultured Tolumonas sp.]